MLTAYVVAWPALLLLSVVLIARAPARFSLTSPAYRRFMAEPWKLATFASATLLITLAAPYSGDPTWDAADSILVSVTVFVFSPWCVATLYREARARRLSAQGLVATILFFVPCWIYDLYILVRDGSYPPTWASNIGLSGAICVLAGLFWNLGWHVDEPRFFTFMWAEWPTPHRTEFRRILPLAVLLAVPVILAVAAFVADYLGLLYPG